MTLLTRRRPSANRFSVRAVSSSSVPGSIDLQEASRRLTKAFGDAYDLYRAMMPVAHSNLIATVPSIGMQFSNDCLYIASEGAKIVQNRIGHSSTVRKEDKLSLKRQYTALRTYGDTVLEEQLVRANFSRSSLAYMSTSYMTDPNVLSPYLLQNLQRLPLMETLDEAEGFTNTDDPRTFNRCERCVKQTVHTLTSLSHAWKVS